jgi:hypothetical protein
MNTKYEAPKLEEMVRLSDIQGRIDAAVRVEREACANIAWGYQVGRKKADETCRWIADAIRARGGK